MFPVQDEDDEVDRDAALQVIAAAIVKWVQQK